MRTKIIALLLVAGVSLPVVAHADPCQGLRGDRQVAGAVVGGLLGGAIGNGVASRGTRDEGTALGALLGAAIGSAVSGDTVNCDYGQTQNTYGQAYGQNYGYTQNYGYANQQPAAVPYAWRNRGHDSYGTQTYGTPVYGSQSYGYQGYGNQGYDRGGYDSYGTRYASNTYGSGSSYGQQQCETVYRVTLLPDGRELREPVQACREPVYTDWRVGQR
jgi:hypothetical protein